MTVVGERAAWCADCRVIWQWYGVPQVRDALCPICCRQLGRKPRAPKGRYRRENQRPLPRERPPLVVREVQRGQ